VITNGSDLTNEALSPVQPLSRDLIVELKRVVRAERESTVAML
jgi:hypothetical protein